MATDFCNGGIPSASSGQYLSGADKAFDNNASTEWWSYTTPYPHWIEYDLGSGVTKVAASYAIMGCSNANFLGWNFQGSNDNSNWTTLDSRTGISLLNGSFTTFTFTNSTAYRYYRLLMTDYVPWGRLKEIEMYESDSLSASLDDSLSLSDSFELQTNPDQQSISDSLLLDDAWDLITTLEPLVLSDNLTLDDSWEVLVNPEQEIMSDSFTLSDSFNILRSLHKILNTDLRWHVRILRGISLSLNWILSKRINTDLRWLGKSQTSINTDLRWLTNPYTILTPITHGDIQIFINSVDILAANDIDVESGNIVHTVSQKSLASFVLARKHDDLDRTHLGVSSQITNQNPIQIYIDGHLEFDGFISSLNVNSDTETIAVTALMEQPLDNRHSIELPLPSVNEKLHIYHCLVNAVQIDNPKESVSTVIVGNNGRYWSGSSWVFYVADALIFGSDVAAQSYITSYVDSTVTQVFRSKSPSVTYAEKNPQYYKGVKINLGTQIQQHVDKYRDIENIIDGKGVIAASLEDGTFIPKPNYSYFWAVLTKNIRTGISNGDYRYIGTSLGSIATDLWVLNGVSPIYQKIGKNIETDLGYYYIGDAPYKEISSKNGHLITVEKWQDRNDGLYNVMEPSYNYINFAKQIADLEYQKLLNIHGDALPIVSSSIEVTFDAYYYYTIKLLTRINVTNTTVPNTFNNTNGFPVSVKGININFKNMKVSLTTDNRLSQIEIDELDAQMPDADNFITDETAVRVYRKFDLKTWQYVS